VSARCAGCEAGIVWTVTVNGKRMPVDELPDPKGYFTLDEQQDPPTAEHIAGRTIEPGTELFTSHFATCPERDRFKGQRGTR